MNVVEFVARQLNDHSDSPSGVEQPTYTEWTETHIEEAVRLGWLYLYSIHPQAFTTVKTKTLNSDNCVVSFCEECDKFIEIISIDGCNNPEPIDARTNDLGDLLKSNCENEESISYTVLDNAPCSIRFRGSVSGAVVSYLCAEAPTHINTDDAKFIPFIPFIVDYALWWLYRTDTESRSNLSRAELHYAAVRDYIQNTLLIEFSMREDDFNYGRQKVEDG